MKNQTVIRVLGLLFILTLVMAGCGINSKTHTANHKLFEKRQHLKGVYFRGISKSIFKEGSYKRNLVQSNLLKVDERSLSNCIEKLALVEFSDARETNRIKLPKSESDTVGSSVVSSQKNGYEPLTLLETQAISPSDTSKLSAGDKNRVELLKKKMKKRGDWGTFLMFITTCLVAGALYVSSYTPYAALALPVIGASIVIGVLGISLLVSGIVLRRRIKDEFGDILEKIGIYKYIFIPLLTAAFIVTFIFGAAFSVWSILEIIGMWEAGGFAPLLIPLMSIFLLIGLGILVASVAILTSLIGIIFVDD